MNEFDYQEVAIVLRIEFKNSLNVGMAESRESKRLVAHAVSCNGTADTSGIQELDCYIAAHPARADLLEEAVAAKHSAGMDRGRRHRGTCLRHPMSGTDGGQSGISYRRRLAAGLVTRPSKLSGVFLGSLRF